MAKKNYKGKKLTAKQKLLRGGAVVLLAAALALFSSDMMGGRWHFLRKPTIQVGAQTVVVDNSLALNKLNQEAFSRTASGELVYTGGKSLRGIDVSTFQGKIDWNAVAEDGIEFAFLRVGFRGYGNGALAADKHFHRNLVRGQKAGIKLGAYFFSQAVNEEEAREEARFVLEQLEGCALELPIVFDWERVELDLAEDASIAPTVRTAGLDGKTVTDCAVAFCEEVRAAGYEGMIYLNNDTGYFLYDLARLQDYPIWYASYKSQWADFYYRTQVWQYSDQGTVNGIDGMVDLDIWFELEEEGEE